MRNKNRNRAVMTLVIASMNLSMCMAEDGYAESAASGELSITFNEPSATAGFFGKSSETSATAGFFGKSSETSATAGFFGQSSESSATAGFFGQSSESSATAGFFGQSSESSATAGFFGQSSEPSGFFGQGSDEGREPASSSADHDVLLRSMEMMLSPNRTLDREPHPQKHSDFAKINLSIFREFSEGEEIGLCHIQSVVSDIVSSQESMSAVLNSLRLIISTLDPVRNFPHTLDRDKESQEAAIAKLAKDLEQLTKKADKLEKDLTSEKDHKQLQEINKQLEANTGQSLEISKQLEERRGRLAEDTKRYEEVLSNLRETIFDKLRVFHNFLIQNTRADEIKKVFILFKFDSSSKNTKFLDDLAKKVVEYNVDESLRTYIVLDAFSLTLEYLISVVDNRMSMLHQSFTTSSSMHLVELLKFFANAGVKAGELYSIVQNFENDKDSSKTNKMIKELNKKIEDEKKRQQQKEKDASEAAAKQALVLSTSKSLPGSSRTDYAYRLALLQKEMYATQRERDAIVFCKEQPSDMDARIQELESEIDLKSGEIAELSRLIERDRESSSAEAYHQARLGLQEYWGDEY